MKESVCSEETREARRNYAMHTQHFRPRSRVGGQQVLITSHTNSHAMMGTGATLVVLLMICFHRKGEHKFGATWSAKPSPSGEGKKKQTASEEKSSERKYQEVEN